MEFESFWFLQEKLLYWRRQFNWLRKHFKIEIRSIFLMLFIMAHKILFFPLKNFFSRFSISYVCTELVIFFKNKLLLKT